MPKVHWSSDPPGEGGLYVAICGWLTPTVAERAEDVSCRNCAKRLPNEPIDRPSAYIRAVFEQKPRGSDLLEASSAFEGELPVLEPKTYARRNCVCGAHDCEVCHFFARLERERFIRPWLERSGPRSSAARFASLSAALRFYLEALDAGLPLLGSQAAGMLRLGRLGTIVSGGTPGSVLESVDDFIAVEAALERAFADYAFGLEPELCVRTILLSSVGRRVAQKSGRILWKAMSVSEVAEELDLEEAKVRAIIRHGRRRMSVDLRGRGIVRP